MALIDEALIAGELIITYVESDKRTTAQQDQTEVSGTDIECADHDDSTNYGDSHGADNVEAVLKIFSRSPRDSESDKIGDDVRRRLNEICDCLGESKSVHNLVYISLRSKSERQKILHTEGRKSLKD